MKTELLIGAGSSRVKKLVPWGHQPTWDNLITLDNNPDHKPDIVHDLEKPYIPLPYDFADEIHAYEVLEHTGQQGDYEFFFAQFSDFWRVLKPGGLLIGSCPSRHSAWAFGDPSHRRIVQPESFVFLVQPEYTCQVGKTAMSDFRHIYKADLDIQHSDDNGESFTFILCAVKPSRYTAP